MLEGIDLFRHSDYPNGQPTGYAEGFSQGAIAQLDADKQEVRELFEKIENDCPWIWRKYNIYWQALIKETLGG